MEGYDHEVVIVDDRSPDKTWMLARDYEKIYPNVKALVREKRGGIGSAIKNGFEICDGDLIVTMDADLSHDPKDIPRFIETMEKTKAAVVVGSRFTEGGRIEGRSWIRNAISGVASKITYMMLGLRTRDVTSGFRLYSRDVLQKVLPRTKCIKFDFQLEVLSRIHEKVVEVPIVFKGEEKAEEAHLTSQDASILSRIRDKIVEVPIVFKERRKGRSKFALSEITSFLGAIWSLFLARQGARFSKFVIVGLSGIAVTEILFWVLREFTKFWFAREFRVWWLLWELGPIWGISQYGTRIFDVLAVIIASEMLILYNFLGNDLWTFRDMAGPGRLMRAVKFNVVSLLGTCACLAIFVLGSVFYGLDQYVALLLGAILASFWNFFMSLNWAWMSREEER